MSTFQRSVESHQLSGAQRREKSNASKIKQFQTKQDSSVLKHQNYIDSKFADQLNYFNSVLTLLKSDKDIQTVKSVINTCIESQNISDKQYNMISCILSKSLGNS